MKTIHNMIILISIGVFFIAVISLHFYINTYPNHIDFMNMTKEQVAIKLQSYEKKYNRNFMQNSFCIKVRISDRIENFYFNNLEHLYANKSIYNSDVWIVNLQERLIYFYWQVLYFKNGKVISEELLMENDITGNKKTIKN